MEDTALLIIDIQQGILDEEPYEAPMFLENVKEVLEIFRSKKLPVFYVQHEGVGLEAGTPPWQIPKCIQPQTGERIFHKKYNSAFVKTNLQAYLQAQGIKNLVITGMQTEYCIDATIKSAFEREYKIYVPKGCHTTCDNGRFTAKDLNEFYAYNIWNGRFAELIEMDQLKARL